ncbi:Abi family protein [Corynebacterium kutscheri]|uniref:Abi family protein n=1 Tax=Corynebacterium kutscheri TaxID=35755 RepID=UPI000F8328D8|nr:Abi family protein [Corynebacterium kutscheri]
MYRVLPVPDDPRQPKRLDEFVPNTTFAQVTALYEFDRKLRTLIHDGFHCPLQWESKASHCCRA